MVSAVRLVAFFASISGVLCQYPCPQGYAAKAGKPTCAGVSDASCKATSCCTLTGTKCSATGWLAGASKCKTDSNMKFYDLAKDSKVATSASDADFRGACCTDCSAATCADWTTNSCGTGKVKKAGTITLASADCSVPTNDAYRTTCCVTAPILCSATGWVFGNPKCKTDSKLKFYDLAKNSKTYTTASDANFRGACCTDCSAATCADWTTNSCGTGKVKKAGTITLASADCSVPTNDAYRTACCVTAPILCSATGWLAGATKCKTDSKLKFYDLAKDSKTYTPASDANFRGACCTDCSAATCADWTTNSCGAGEYKKAGTITLASADCSVPTNDAYRTACCAPPMECSAYVGDADASAALPTFPFFTSTLLASLAVVVGVHRP